MTARRYITADLGRNVQPSDAAERKNNVHHMAAAEPLRASQDDTDFVLSEAERTDPRDDLGLQEQPVEITQDSGIPAGSDENPKRPWRQSRSKILLVALLLAVIASFWVLTDIGQSGTSITTPTMASLDDTQLALLNQVSKDHVFLVSRVSELERNYATLPPEFGDGAAIQNEITQLASEFQALVVTMAELAGSAESQQERLDTLESKLSRVDAMDKRINDLVATNKAPAPAKPAAPARQASRSETAPTPVPEAKVDAPWVIMALSGGSIFVRDKESGEQKLLRVGSEAAPCGKVLSIDVVAQSVTTESCNLLRR